MVDNVDEQAMVARFRTRRHTHVIYHAGVSITLQLSFLELWATSAKITVSKQCQ